MPFITRRQLPGLTALALGAVTAFAAEEVRDIDRSGAGRAIPIALSGYTGEVARVLEFDLEVVGFKVVADNAAGANWTLAGKDAGRVEGTLKDNGQVRLAKAYSGADLRLQAHALADDVVKAVQGVPGIARTRIAFKRDKGGSSEVYVADYDGHNTVAVSSDGSVVAAPSWVPGQLKLFYTSYVAGNPDILAHDLGTGKRSYVARYTGSNMSPAASPDGSMIAMILSKGGSPDLYVAKADGSGLRQLTHTKEDEASPCWSSDGRTLCFSTRMGGRRVLATVPAAGGAPKRLATSGVANPSEPAWSPDGQWIAFTAQMGGFEVCRVKAGGGTAEVLTSGEDPCWAPNSRTLLYVRRDGRGGRTLSLLDVPTKQRKDVRTGLGSCSQPSWAY
ncbi:MAG: PD40 domain-containing protein [Verrucomicrobiales bacterium]|nr:PD40 domain-containing protein [Verrucomicrobiales bacterium]